jgi:hypothetical protein
MVVSVVLSQRKEPQFATLGCTDGDDEGCDGPRRTEPGAAMEAHFDSVFSKTSKLFDASAKRGGASGGMALGRPADADRGGFSGPVGCFLLTYDATTGEAQNTAYR